VQAQVTLLPELSLGRRLLTTGQYRFHIVIGLQSQRVAVRNANLITEKYLGVMFVDGPEAMGPGESAEVSLALMYSPEKPTMKLCREPYHDSRRVARGGFRRCPEIRAAPYTVFAVCVYLLAV
jgi:hypothetical protein